MLKDKARRGYWCECWTEDLTDEGELVLRASFDAYTVTAELFTGTRPGDHPC
ncbi:hypothetical protein [Streptomyces sp. NPDC058479]|uniref:hypothetical protein n=1 Tax=unclassified Streptomyces TaxID=2593676 RepID=UPI003667209E